MERRFTRIARRVALAGLLFAALGGASFVDALFAPSAELWEVWTAHDETSTARVDHTAWDRLLGKHVTRGGDGIARFSYRRVSKTERAALDGYVARLTSVRVGGLGRAEQFAYWVNLYNALTVRLILDHPEARSIRDIDISPGLFADGPWDAKLAAVEGRAVTLNDIEHRILRPIFRDPRIHYAVNCASLGCPDLAGRAFTAENREILLEEGARLRQPPARRARRRRRARGVQHLCLVRRGFRRRGRGARPSAQIRRARPAEQARRRDRDCRPRLRLVAQRRGIAGFPPAFGIVQPREQPGRHAQVKQQVNDQPAGHDAPFPALREAPR